MKQRHAHHDSVVACNARRELEREQAKVERIARLKLLVERDANAGIADSLWADLLQMELDNVRE